MQYFTFYIEIFSFSRQNTNETFKYVLGFPVLMAWNPSNVYGSFWFDKSPFRNTLWSLYLDDDSKENLAQDLEGVMLSRPHKATITTLNLTLVTVKTLRVICQIQLTSRLLECINPWKSFTKSMMPSHLFVLIR